jgi:hypothetical protein
MFVVALAQREKHGHEMGTLATEKRALEAKVKDSSVLRYRGSKSRISAIDAQLEDMQLTRTILEKDVYRRSGGQSASRFDTILQLRATEVVEQYPRAMELWAALNKDYGKADDGSGLVGVISRKVMYHLCRPALEYYESIAGQPHGI